DHLNGAANWSHSVQFLLESTQLPLNFGKIVVVFAECLGSLFEASVGIIQTLAQRIEFVVETAKFVSDRSRVHIRTCFINEVEANLLHIVELIAKCLGIVQHGLDLVQLFGVFVVE